jgi:hypothetical protein
MGMKALIALLLTWPCLLLAAGGAKAANSGLTFEATLQAALESKGYKAVQYAQWEKTHTVMDSAGLLVLDVPYETIYGSRGLTEFVLYTEDGPIRIEAKWQQSPGSVDEKLPYLFQNALEKMPEQHVIIVIDGPGWREGALAWLRHAAAEQGVKRIDVFSLSEFLVYVNESL